MKSVVISLLSDDRSIEYSMDISGSTFAVAMVDSEKRDVVQSGPIGASDVDKQDLALRMYHVILAALRSQSHGSG